MTSKLSGRIAADANVILSAAAYRAASRVFEEAQGLTVVTTAFNFDEVRKYLPELSQQYGLKLSDVADHLRVLPLRVYGEETYASHLEEARKLVGERDLDDVALLSLALALSIPIWSNDKHFAGLPVIEVFSTARLLASLGIFSRKE